MQSGSKFFLPSFWQRESALSSLLPFFSSFRSMARRDPVLNVISTFVLPAYARFPSPQIQALDGDERRAESLSDVSGIVVDS